MSVAVNLLPDTRQVKMRANQRRRLFIGIAAATWITCCAVLVALVLVSASQKIVIANTTKDISAKKLQLEGISGLSDALTAQQHLASLSNLYGQRVYMSKFLDVYMHSAPSDLTLASLNLDESNQLTVTGNAKSYASVAKLARALEDQNVSLGANAAPTNTPYFSDVSIQTASRTTDKVNFSLSATASSGVTSGTK